MIVVKEIEEIPALPGPCGLTIGSFDGIHLGHLFLLQKLREKVSGKGTIGVFTFANHPSQVLSQNAAAPLIASLEYKLLLLKRAGVDLVVLQEFTPAFSEQTYKDFFLKMRRYFPFSFLLLGEGASLGKNKQGDAKSVKELGQEWGFEADYMPKILKGETPISSGRIRSAIQQGNFAEIEELLGRPYSLYGLLSPSQILSTPGLCTPPFGSYKVTIFCEHISYPATVLIANGEVIIQCEKNLGGKTVEILFSH